MNPDEFQNRAAALEEQVRLVEGCSDPATRAAALALLRSVMELHQEALAHILAVIKNANAAGMLDALVSDPLVSNILLLHDLHPWELQERITAAIAALQPKLTRYGATARVTRIGEDQTVYLHLDIDAHCGSTAETLKSMVERELLDAAPDATIVVEAPSAPASGFIPLASLATTNMQPALLSTEPSKS